MNIYRASVYERLHNIKISPAFFADYKFSIHQSLFYQSVPKGANILKMSLDRAKRVKKFYERSEFIVAFAALVSQTELAKNCPYEARYELQQSTSFSEYLGQFALPSRRLLIIF